MKLISCVLLVLLISLSFTEVSALFDRNKETLVIPYTAFNNQGSNTEHFSEEHLKSETSRDWLLAINNNLIYNPDNPESIVVLRIKEHEQSEEYIEFIMDRQNKVFIAVSSKETGYLTINNDEDSWFPDKPLLLLFTETDDGRITISNGKSTLVDRLEVGELVAQTIEFYGIGYSESLPVVLDGHIKLEITSGNPVSNFPLMFLMIVVGFGAAIFFTLRGFKSSKERWQGKSPAPWR